MSPKLKTYLELCRLPAVFTAAADIFLGLALTGRFSSDGSSIRSLIIGLVASAGLYLGGMVLNDILDRRQDAEERPSRPIPSGRVSIRAAIIFYSVLTLIGLAAAAFGGMVTLSMAAVVAVCVWLYDGPLKRTPAGPAMMGLCRVGNVLLGASVGISDWRPLTETPVWSAAAILGLYITGLTLFARTEAVLSKRWRLAAGVLIVNAAIIGIGVWATTYGQGGAVLLVALAAIALLLDRRLFAAVRDPRPERVGPAVKHMLLSVPILDAVLIAAAAGPPGTSWAVACALLVIPAATAGRILKLT